MYYGVKNTGYSQEKLTEVRKILKLGVNRANTDKDTAITTLEKLLRDVRITGRPYFLVNFVVFEWLYLVHIGPTNAKHEDFADLVFVFVILSISSGLSHNKQTRIQPPSV